jgi:hypothetical protein
VEVDEEFTYVVQRGYFADASYGVFFSGSYSFLLGMVVGEKYTLSVTELDTIPILINESSQMPASTCNLEPVNDSLSTISSLQDFVYPIGDWEFVDQMTNLTGQEGITLVDTADEWGVTGSFSFALPDSTVVTHSVDIRYEKEYGTLNYMRLRFTTLGSDLADVILVNWHPGMPTVAGGGLQMSTILIIGIASVIGVIVFILVYQWYRAKKPIVQKLGE